MTIVEQIMHEAEALPAAQRKEALKMLQSMRSQIPSSKSPHRKTSGQARAALNAAKGMWKDRTKNHRKMSKAEISSAVRGIAGMWKDRTDLPKDPVQAVKILRSRMGSRGRDG